MPGLNQDKGPSPPPRDADRRRSDGREPSYRVHVGGKQKSRQDLFPTAISTTGIRWDKEKKSNRKKKKKKRAWRRCMFTVSNPASDRCDITNTYGVRGAK